MLLDFRTDSSRVSFSCKVARASSQQLGFLDIHVDGKLRIHAGRGDLDENEIDVDLNLPKGEKRVTVFFPNLFSSRIRDFRIDEDAAFEKIEKKQKFLFFGDSITQGYTSEFPSLSYANLIGTRFRAEILNQAIGGEFFDTNHLENLPVFSPDVIFVAYGTNDWSVEKDIPHNAAAYFDKLTRLYPKARIVDILPIWRTDIEVKNKINRCSFENARETIKKICSAYDAVTVFDGIDYVPHFPLFYRDHVHPNESGNLYFADALEKDLRKIL